MKDKTTDPPLQDNYEEVEMDIDSEPGSPGNRGGESKLISIYTVLLRIHFSLV